MIVPNPHNGTTKKTWITFYNEEAEEVLNAYLKKYDPKDRLFYNTNTNYHHPFRIARKKSGLNITPQVLREWFCSEMGRLGVPDRYIDAFCGRVPRSILARHYTDYSPERLKEIYDKTKLVILNPSC
jgi:intergrase/recombinase